MLKDRDALEQLARDEDDNVAEAAVDGLRKLAGHDADARLRRGSSTRNGHQILRAAALALDGTPHPDQAVPALQAAWQRLVAEGHDNSHDARDAIAKTLTALGDRAEDVHADGRRRTISTPRICAGWRRRARG